MLVQNLHDFHISTDQKSHLLPNGFKIINYQLVKLTIAIQINLRSLFLKKKRNC